MHQLESFTALPVIFMAILFGFLYEALSNRYILFIGFLIVPFSLLLIWSTNFTMLSIGKMILAIGYQIVLQNPLMNRHILKSHKNVD